MLLFEGYEQYDGSSIREKYNWKPHAIVLVLELLRDNNFIHSILFPSAGKYCIYKWKECPAGLTQGFVKWDDDDDDNKFNDKGGTLPNGTYHHNTEINFCCRTDGNKSHPILLSSKTPFFLLAYGSAGCQMIKWAVVTQEWIHYDTESVRNDDQATGAYPYDAGKKHPTIHYCYYRDK